MCSDERIELKFGIHIQGMILYQFNAKNFVKLKKIFFSLPSSAGPYLRKKTARFRKTKPSVSIVAWGRIIWQSGFGFREWHF